jgi:tRNA(Ile2)-agmatinylcytidine synthase
MSNMFVQIGMDDIDSPEGGCTTHFASLIVEKLTKWNVEWVDYPNLIRLNPSVPYRTRGNGAVALRFLVDQDAVDPISTMINEHVHDYVTKIYPNTNPGVVILRGKVPAPVVNLSGLALWRVVPIELARRVINRCDIIDHSSGNGRGLVGALASIGNTLGEDYTYEYIAYRAREDTKEQRSVEVASVEMMDKKMGDAVFSNIDMTSGRMMIEPHGPDPVLYGVRGETANSVIEAGTQVKSQQRVDRWMVFRSNQGTGEHLKHRVAIRNLRPYMAAVVEGRVASRPRMIEGGHAIFSIEDEAALIDCAAYEPSGEFRETVMKLVGGDLVKIHAGVRPASRTHGLTLNLEGLEIVELAQVIKISNPLCPQCGKRMKSAGSGQGYKCVKCGHKDKEIEKIETALERDLQTGLHLPPERAQRHLTRPHARIGKMNSGSPTSLVAKWHSH